MAGTLAQHQKLVVEYCNLSAIRPYERNARKIPQSAVDAVAKSLREFGWQQPLVVDSGGVLIVGHVRRLAALQEGMTEAPVVVAAHLTPAQVRQYRLMDNRSHDEAKWDADILTAELLDMRALDLDLSLTGFGSGELDRLLLQPNAGEDEVPPVPDAPVSRLGDLWLCGDHRVLCGDATNAGDVARLCVGSSVAMLTGDPPYGVDYSGGRGKVREKFANDFEDVGAYGEFVLSALQAWDGLTAEKGALYLWFADLQAEAIFIAVRKAGWRKRCVIQWAKNTFSFGRAIIHYHQQNEPCVYAAKCSTLPNWYGPGNERTIWNFDKPTTSPDHPTQKPVELYRRSICNSTQGGAIVGEMFLGSGTTLIAAELTGRICYGLEISPAYCDVIVARWEKLTGKQATLDGHGSTFEHVKYGHRLEAEDALKEEALKA